MLMKGNTGDWEVIIGLEIHAQIKSNSKLFSGSPTEFGSDPNTQVSLVDAAMPGMLPVINEHCVEQAVKTGLALKAQINLKSIFDRKNYFYPDLPQGYQISQFSHPIVGKGKLILDMKTGSREIGITRLHLEQDAGKSLHDQSPDSTFIDLNRAGIALMEIVSEPDLRTAEEAAEYMKKMRMILRYVESCDGDMEKGSLRCDANVSVRKPGDKLGTRCEIKNINSVRYIVKAIEYEAQRQIDIIESGGKIDQETRLFDPDKGETRTMRSKEDAHDYRYFPDPDLYPLVLTQEYVDKIKKTLPELPDQKKDRYMSDMKLSAYDAGVLISEKEISKRFEEILKVTTLPPKAVANLFVNEIFGQLNKADKSLDILSIEGFKQVYGALQNQTISGAGAKVVITKWIENPNRMPENIIKEEGLEQVTNTGEIEKVIDEVMSANPDKVAEYRSGKDKLFGFFVGQVMKASQGKANPAMVNDILKKKLS